MEKKIENFTLASISATTVIFTGGEIDGKDSKSCFALDVLNNKWYDQELPELVQARWNHSSCCVGSYVYVFAGSGDGWLKSIE